MKKAALRTSRAALGTLCVSGYLFEIHVSEDCYEYPQTFVALLGHELAHVLLTATNHPAKDSELHADLVPIVLGLSSLVTKGRTIYETAPDGTRTKTTYGYLKDPQFQHACNYVSSVLERRVRGKRGLSILCGSLRRKIEKGRLGVDHFCALRDYLDSHLPRGIGQPDGLKLVELHRPGYVDGWEARIAEARRFLERAQTHVELNHYFRDAVDTESLVSLQRVRKNRVRTHRYTPEKIRSGKPLSGAQLRHSFTYGLSKLGDRSPGSSRTKRKPRAGRFVQGFKRITAVRFNPAGDSLYILDFGVMEFTTMAPNAIPRTGVLWQVVKAGK